MQIVYHVVSTLESAVCRVYFVATRSEVVAGSKKQVDSSQWSAKKSLSCM